MGKLKKHIFFLNGSKFNLSRLITFGENGRPRWRRVDCYLNGEIGDDDCRCDDYRSVIVYLQTLC